MAMPAFVLSVLSCVVTQAYERGTVIPSLQVREPTRPKLRSLAKAQRYKVAQPGPPSSAALYPHDPEPRGLSP